MSFLRNELSKIFEENFYDGVIYRDDVNFIMIIIVN